MCVRHNNHHRTELNDRASVENRAHTTKRKKNDLLLDLIFYCPFERILNADFSESKPFSLHTSIEYMWKGFVAQPNESVDSRIDKNQWNKNHRSLFRMVFFPNLCVFLIFGLKTSCTIFMCLYIPSNHIYNSFLTSVSNL